MRYINQKAIREFFKQRGKRVGRDFLFAVDSFLQSKFNAVDEVHLGGRKTLTQEIAHYVGLVIDQKRRKP